MRHCGCPADPRVFGHTTCQARPPWMEQDVRNGFHAARERYQRDQWSHQEYAKAFEVRRP
jgi:hypothetical protein